MDNLKKWPKPEDQTPTEKLHTNVDKAIQTLENAKKAVEKAEQAVSYHRLQQANYELDKLKEENNYQGEQDSV